MLTQSTVIMSAALAATAALSGCKGNESAAPSPTAPAPASVPERAPADPSRESTSIYPLKVKRLDGTETALSAWAGKVLLVVNTASECGYTPQYEDLQALHAKYEARGFAVLGFPSNDFGGQEPGSSQEIATFCKTRFGITFPMFEKVHTTGSARDPLYALLSEAKGEPKWNFHKYLVDKQGRPVAAWPSAVKPDSTAINRAIEAELAAR